MRNALGALACFVVAAVLALVAADVARWPDALRAGDVRYRVAPEEDGLWRPGQRVPGEPARRLLGVGDDLELRDALRTLRLSKLDNLVISDPKLALLRGEARARLQALAGGDAEAATRSRAMGLLGALSFASALNEVRERVTHLQEAVRSFHDAIVTDPENAEAKLNLELALQRSRGVEAAEGSGGPNPSPGGAGSRGAGAGTPGSGY
ncbi:MAG: hypothetical protein WD689_10000 [Gaiellaceae bacterium]